MSIEQYESSFKSTIRVGGEGWDGITEQFINARRMRDAWYNGEPIVIAGTEFRKLNFP